MKAFPGASPKPTKRPKKPHKPIARSKKPIARRSRPARVRRTPKGLEKHAADLAWADYVRRASSDCVITRLSILAMDALGWTMFVPFDEEERTFYVHTVGRCRSDPQDAAHVISRRYGATRHDTNNGVRLCRTAHKWFTRHPAEWEKFIREVIGAEKYEALRIKALAGPKGY